MNTKEGIVDWIKLLYKAILAGGAIALGGIANIASQNKIAGSLFFCIGLFLVLSCSLNLFTGKICYLWDNKPIYLAKLAVIYQGNFLGAVTIGSIVGHISKFDSLLTAYAEGLQARISAPWWQIILLGLLCNVLIYVAVEGYRSLDKEWKKVLALILGVSVFVLCGFEHSIADMFYLSACGIWSGKGVLFVLLVTIGNVLGGLLIPTCNRLIKLLERRTSPKLDEPPKTDPPANE